MDSEEQIPASDTPQGGKPTKGAPRERSSSEDTGQSELALGDQPEESDEFDVAAFFAAGATSPGAGTTSKSTGPAPGGASEGAASSPARSAGGSSSPKPPPPDAGPLDLPELSFGAVGGDTPDHMDLLSDVDLNVTIELGRTRMLVEDVLRLTQGSVVELDKLAGDPVDVYVNERLVAKGEVLVLNDNFCVRINELVSEEVRRSA